jgi:hypothetical protein
MTIGEDARCDPHHNSDDEERHEKAWRLLRANSPSTVNIGHLLNNNFYNTLAFFVVQQAPAHPGRARLVAQSAPSPPLSSPQNLDLKEPALKRCGTKLELGE